MKILIISQMFWPGSGAVSQNLTDIAEELARKGHDVFVLTSQSDYEDPSIHFPASEFFKGIAIKRIWQTAFTKSTKLGRLFNFSCFNLFLFYRLLLLPRNRYDLILGLTLPPLVSFFGVIAAKLKSKKFCYWAMDLQPELAINSGYLKESGSVAKLLLSMGNVVFKKADLILTLDRYMAAYIVKRGARKDKIRINPVWPVIDQVYTGPIRENPFRLEHGLTDKIVVMYSGNHAVVHPLDTLLETTLFFKDDLRFVFVFIGGGVRKQDVTRMKTEYGLTNILQLPYQKRDKIHFSIGAADIHIVIQGNGCTGFTHPSKIYGAMFVGCPIAYIGPEPSHIGDILSVCPGNISVEHGQAKELVKKLLLFADKSEEERNTIGLNNSYYAQTHFNKSKLINALIKEIETMDTLVKNEQRAAYSVQSLKGTNK